MITLTAILIGATMQVRDARFLPVDTIEQAGFAGLRASGQFESEARYEKMHVECVRKSDEVTLTILLARGPATMVPGFNLSDQTSRQNAWELDCVGAVPLSKKPPPSSMPVGQSCSFQDERTFSRIVAKSAHEFVNVGIRDPVPGQGEIRVRRDRSADHPFLELVARRTMALFAGRRLTANGTTTVAGTKVERWKNAKSSEFHVNLAQWATARGWEVIRNDDRGTALLTKGSRMMIVPLGSCSIKVDSKWVDVGDVVAEDQGRWLVPLPGLERANG